MYEVKTINEEQLAKQLKLLEGKRTFSCWHKGHIPETAMVVSMSRRHNASRAGGTDVGRRRAALGKLQSLRVITCVRLGRGLPCCPVLLAGERRPQLSPASGVLRNTEKAALLFWG